MKCIFSLFMVWVITGVWVKLKCILFTLTFFLACLYFYICCSVVLYALFFLHICDFAFLSACQLQNVSCLCTFVLFLFFISFINLSVLFLSTHYWFSTDIIFYYFCLIKNVFFISFICWFSKIFCLFSSTNHCQPNILLYAHVDCLASRRQQINKNGISINLKIIISNVPHWGGIWWSNG